MKLILSSCDFINENSKKVILDNLDKDLSEYRIDEVEEALPVIDMDLDEEYENELHNHIDYEDKKDEKYDEGFRY